MKRRVAKFYKGYGSYPEKYDYYQLQEWNSVYKYWYSVNSGFLGLEFVQKYCLLKKIDYSAIPHVYIKKESK